MLAFPKSAAESKPGKKDMHIGSARPVAARLFVAISLVAALAYAEPSIAERALRESEAELVHFAFATQLGSGVYSIGGRTVQIYRLPFAWTIAEPEDGRPGVRLRLPATIGLYDFAARDVIESGLPDRLDTFSAAAGLELDFPLADGWHVVPYAEAGHAWDRSSDADAVLYSASLHARREWSAGDRDFRLNTGFVYAAVNFDGAQGTSDLAKLEAGLELRRLAGFELAGGRADIGFYLLAEWYADRPGEPVVRSAGPDSLPMQFEAGFTLGARPRMKIWKLPLPRVGLAYRFGDGISAYRLVLGAPF